METFVDKNRVLAIMSFVKKYFIILVIMMIAGASASYYYGTFLKEKRIATFSKVLVERKAEDNVAQQFTAQQLDVNVIETYKDVINTPDVVNPALKKLKQQYNEQFSEYKFSDVVKSISVQHQGDSQVFKVQAIANSADKSAKLSNAISNEFQKQIPKIMKYSNVRVLSKAQSNNGTLMGMTLKTRIVLGAGIGLVVTMIIAFVKELVGWMKE